MPKNVNYLTLLNCTLKMSILCYVCFTIIKKKKLLSNMSCVRTFILPGPEQTRPLSTRKCRSSMAEFGFRTHFINGKLVLEGSLM